MMAVWLTRRTEQADHATKIAWRCWLFEAAPIDQLLKRYSFLFIPLLHNIQRASLSFTVSSRAMPSFSTLAAINKREGQQISCPKNLFPRSMASHRCYADFRHHQHVPGQPSRVVCMSPGSKVYTPPDHRNLAIKRGYAAATMPHAVGTTRPSAAGAYRRTLMAGSCGRFDY